MCACPVRGDVLLSDDFSSAPLNPAWVNAGNHWAWWDLAGNGVVHSDGTLPVTLTRALSSAATRDWTVDLRYGWWWGAGHASRVQFFMLDANANGYGVYIEGDTDAEIEKMTAGTVVAWKPLTKTADLGGSMSGGGLLRQVRLTWERATGTLSFYEGNPQGPIGTNLNLLGSYVDTAHTSFTQFQLRDVSAGGYLAVFDDVRIQMAEAVPEPATLALVAFAGLGFLAHRRRRRAGTL